MTAKLEDAAEIALEGQTGTDQERQAAANQLIDIAEEVSAISEVALLLLSKEPGQRPE